MPKDLYVFDFDGTLTRKDSLKEFIKFSLGPMRYYLGLLRLSPLLGRYALGLVRNDFAKERLMTYFFRGWQEKAFLRSGREYADKGLDKVIRPKALDYIARQRSKGCDVVVVSASMEAWLRPWCERYGLQLLCTKMEARDGQITGKFEGKNCYGPEKAKRLREAFDLKAYRAVHAFGDSRGDKELLAMADHGYYRYFH